MSATIADMDGNLVDHDLLYAVVLPNLVERIDDPELKKQEYTVEQARRVDFASLPLQYNHNDDLPPVGRTVGYRVNDRTGAAPRAEVLFKLNREHEQPGARDQLSELTSLQRNLLMTGAHRGVSLGHYYTTEYIDDCGHHHASASGVPGRVIKKEAYEISTCAKGRREGSDIYEYLPCKRSLLRSTDAAVRSFAELYGYTVPSANLHKQHTEWPRYIDQLHGEVAKRRIAVIENNGYGQMLRARGFHAASADRQSLDALSSAPWMFVPYMAQRNVPGADTQNIFENLSRETSQVHR
jgi:hypothetical protein